MGDQWHSLDSGHLPEHHGMEPTTTPVEVNAVVESFFDEAAYYNETLTAGNFRDEHGYPIGEGTGETFKTLQADDYASTEMVGIENAIDVSANSEDYSLHFTLHATGDEMHYESHAAYDDQCYADMEAHSAEEDDEDIQDRLNLEAAYNNYLGDDILLSAYRLMPVLDENEDFAHPTEKSLEGRGELSVAFQERWDVDAESVQYLASVMRATKAAHTEQQMYGIRTTFRDLKLEEPLLRTDPAKDMTKILERNEVKLDVEDVAPFKVKDDDDEGIEWGATNLGLPKRVSDELKNEKWAVEPETAGFMREIFSGLEGDLQDWLAEYRKRRVIRKVSSPILPLSPPLSPEKLPLEIAQIELTSTPEDPSLAEAAALDAQLADRDEREAEESMATETNNLTSFLDAAMVGSSSPLQRKAKRLQDLKVSDPIMPETSSEPPTKKVKTVSFTEELHTLIPRLPSEEEFEGQSTDEAMELMSTILTPLAKPGLDRLEQEQLVEVDTTLRVSIPPVDEIVPIAPWLPYQNRQVELMVDTVNQVLRTTGKWDGVSKLEKALPWSPFPSYLGKIKPEGDFDDGSYERYLAEVSLEGDVDLATLTWKPDGLRALDEDEDEDEELEACDISDDEMEGTDMPRNGVRLLEQPAMRAKKLSQPTGEIVHSTSQQTATKSTLVCPRQEAPEAQSGIPTIAELIKQRKAQIEADKNTQREPSHSYGHLPQVQQAPEVVGKTNSKPTQQKRKIEQDLNLNQFLALHRQRPTIKPSPTEAITTPEVVHTPAPPPATAAEPESTIPTPLINPNEITATIITSPTLDRRIATNLSTHCPNLEEILRQPITTTTTASEEDITLSPSTGLILTTIQKLKQKPLPGSSKDTTFLTHLTKISTHYSNLVILISASTNNTTHDDLSTLNTFTSQTTRLSSTCEIQPIYIPTNSTETLIAYITAYIQQHQSTIKLHQQETFWERFLRTAGFNAFAAQAILSHSKKDLASFVLMSEDERVEKFGVLLGGEKILRRASEVIDARWRSIANVRG